MKTVSPGQKSVKCFCPSIISSLRSSLSLSLSALQYSIVSQISRSLSTDSVLRIITSSVSTWSWYCHFEGRTCQSRSDAVNRSTHFTFQPLKQHSIQLAPIPLYYKEWWRCESRLSRKFPSVGNKWIEKLFPSCPRRHCSQPRQMTTFWQDPTLKLRSYRKKRLSQLSHS